VILLETSGPVQNGGLGGGEKSGAADIYVVAAFRINAVNAVSYQKLRTLKGLANHIQRIIVEKQPDYISVRIIKGE